MKAWRLTVVVALLAAGAVDVPALTLEGEVQRQCKGYRYEPLEGAKPLLLMFSDGIKLDWLADRAGYAATRGFNGFLIGGIMSNQESNVWVADGDAASVGEADLTLQAARRANSACRQVGITHNFLLTSFSGRLPDWWDDAAWSKIHENFRQAARFAKAGGFAGICIDSEYVGEQYHYQWPGYKYDHYTTADLRRAARRRMSEMVAAMYDEWPDMEFFLVHADDAPIAFEVLAGWIEEAARRNAPGGLHLGTESTYDACNVAYILAHAIDRSRLVEQRLSPRAKQYWRARCGLSPGGWPLRMDSDFDGRAFKRARLSVQQFRAMMAGLNMASRKYTWIYPAGPTWWQASSEEVERYRLSSSAALPPVADLGEYYRIAAGGEQVSDDAMKQASQALRTMSIRDPDALIASLGLKPIWVMQHPDNQITRALVPADYHALDWTARQVERINNQEAKGLRPNVTRALGFVRTFSVIGPFSNERWEGHDRPYPPEQRVDLSASCEGIGGPVAWQQVIVPDGQGYLDFAQILKPKDWTVAYALCYVHSVEKQRAQIRAGTNDSMKLWFNGRLAAEWYDPNGRWAVVDDEVVPVTLPSGWSTILVKVAQTTGNWGMYLRITDEKGAPLRGIRVSARPK